MKIILCFGLFVFCFGPAPAQDIQRIFSVDAQQVLADLDTNTSVIIDGRDSAKFCLGHLESAVCLNAFSDSAQKMLMHYLDYKSIFVYCTTENRSETIIEILQKLNYCGTIICMMDGFSGWIENGFPVEKDIKN
ncbi:MAG: hypothetical protein A2W93_01725 [Bacteroidetes bacterium GWF2_43_63]|nr:MAG: hypothetical protein A2W94_10350 [Bacteroidetes bacterium GWE2_42_42]OFY55785.1 MAG: hypothetical protein A2W93_01725 [Bacteroidetes bacterium GWF2_43_63]HBG71297.1 hypothetical protein [Bacteroidales bacterium]HCB60482.1 hypothetical protein [Bacteroidales bacterium]HCY22561.1 hypothetical protein [Bacteroidales bacterium]